MCETLFSFSALSGLSAVQIKSDFFTTEAAEYAEKYLIEKEMF